MLQYVMKWKIYRIHIYVHTYIEFSSILKRLIIPLVFERKKIIVCAIHSKRIHLYTTEIHIEVFVLPMKNSIDQNTLSLVLNPNTYSNILFIYLDSRPTTYLP